MELESEMRFKHDAKLIHRINHGPKIIVKKGAAEFSMLTLYQVILIKNYIQ